MHAHSDLAVLADPEHLAKTMQGFTTEVVGQDGIGYAPVSESVSEPNGRSPISVMPP